MCHAEDTRRSFKKLTYTLAQSRHQSLRLAGITSEKEGPQGILHCEVTQSVYDWYEYINASTHGWHLCVALESGPRLWGTVGLELTMDLLFLGAKL